MGCTEIIDVMCLSLHDRVVFEGNVVVPKSYQLLKEGSRTGNSEEGLKNRSSREVLSEEDACPSRCDRNDVEFLAEA